MATQIYSFTGSRGAPAIPRRLAEGLTDADVIRMSPEGPADRTSDDDRAGLLFPAFGWGLPPADHLSSFIYKAATRAFQTRERGFRATNDYSSSLILSHLRDAPPPGRAPA